MAPIPEPAARDQVFNSWKDIANYLHRGVRTVQRWECELALPVHRPPGKSRGGVSAVRSELDHWLSVCPTGTGEIQPHPGPTRGLNRGFHKTSDLVFESRQLRADLTRIRKGLRVAVKRVARTMQYWQTVPARNTSDRAKPE